MSGSFTRQSLIITCTHHALKTKGKECGSGWSSHWWGRRRVVWRAQTTAAKETTPRPTLCDKCVDSLMSHRVMNIEVLWDGTDGFSSLSKKTSKSNRLQMSLQRQHFLLSYLKTLSVVPAGVRTHDLPHGSPVLNQLDQDWWLVFAISKYFRGRGIWMCAPKLIF